MFGSNYTIKIEINLDLYKDDVRDLLKNLFDVEGKGKIEYAGRKNEKEMRRVMFLLGLADIPEREGAGEWAIGEAEEADNRATQIANAGGQPQPKIKHVEIVKAKIKQYTSTNKKCFMTITTDKPEWGLKFTVKNYSRISPEKCSSYTRKVLECDGDTYYGGCQGNMKPVDKTVPVFCPKLIPDATSNGGINLINWGWRNKQFGKGVWEEWKNENTFTFDTNLDIKEFIEEFKKPKILQIDGTFTPSSDNNTQLTVPVAVV